MALDKNIYKDCDPGEGAFIDPKPILRTSFAEFLIKFCNTYPYIFVRVGHDPIICSYVVRLMDFNVNPPVYADLAVNEIDFDNLILDNDEVLKEAVRSCYKKLVKERNKSGWETAS